MIGKIKRAFKRAAVRAVRARQRRAAEQLAMYLVATDRDFARVGTHELTNKILSKKAVHLHD